MVTIEQKLSSFSKLLQQDIANTAKEQLRKLEEEYIEKIAISKEHADKEAQEIIDKATRKAELKKTEIISKSKISNKRDSMLAKEKCIERFIENLATRIDHFLSTKDYKDYLGRLISKCEELKDYPNEIAIYTTQKDHDFYLPYIKEQLINLGIDEKNIEFKVNDNSMIGGLIVEDVLDKVRIDLSIASYFEESKAFIIESVFEAIREAGEVDE